jgi:threonine/homoserine/homoserine lactone efflux protein
MNELLGPLVLFAAAVTLTPGPNVVLVTASAANFGFRRTAPQMLGITVGFGAMVLATGLGLAGVVHAEPRLHAVMKYAGGGYLTNPRTRRAFNWSMATLLALSLIPVSW